MAWALDGIRKGQEDKDRIFDIIRDMQLYDKTKELDVQATIQKLRPILQNEKIDPAGKIMQKALSDAVANLQTMDPAKAKKLSELQEELKKMKLA